MGYYCLSPFGLLWQYHRCINNITLVLTVMEGGNSMIKVPVDCLVRAHFLFSLLLMSPYGIRGKGVLCDHSVRALISFIRPPALWTKYLPKIPPHNTITLGVWISTYEFGGDTNILSMPITKNGHHQIYILDRLLKMLSMHLKWTIL